MRIFTKSAVMALALSGTALVTAGAANADRYDGRDRSGPIISIGLGNVAFGYRDGYWDGGHRWHHWRHNRDYRTYRDQDGSNYHNWNHDRDGNDGWQGH